MGLLYNIVKDYNYSWVSKGGDKNLYIPLNVDTEFQTVDLRNPCIKVAPSPTITLQVKGIDKKDKGIIYTHPDCNKIARHTVMREPFVGFQYLKDNGYEISFERKNWARDSAFKLLPKMHFHLYGHFLVADLIRLFTGDYQDDIRDLVAYSTGKKGIKQERRIRTYTSYGKRFEQYCSLKWVASLDNVTYQVCLELRCTSGLAGAISYKSLGNLAGVEIPDKDLLTQKQKGDMMDTYLKTPLEFDAYALNDLKSYEMVKGIETKIHKLQECFGIEKIFSPKLTIGRTVADNVKAVLLNKVGDSLLFKTLTQHANANYLKRENNSRIYLTKCDGGRAFNNRPLDTSVKKPVETDLIKLMDSKNFLCDIDIDGAYGNGLCVQEYPLGIPCSFGNKLGENTAYFTLNEFLKKHGDDLVEGLWIARVTTSENLKYEQDLIASWIISDSKILTRNSDTENEEECFEDIVDEGYTKVFTNEITLGIISHDILQWIDNICSKPQRRELLDKLLVIDAMWYPKSKRLYSVKEVSKKFEEFEGKHTSKVVNDETLITERYCHYWTSFNLGDLMVKKLINERQKHPKKTPYNDFYKLIINTIYGDLVSRYFDIGNVVVGNNITARCRCMAWYLEKGLNAYQTITDGCVFDLSQVIVPVKGKRATANNLVRGYSKTVRDRQWKTATLKIYKQTYYETPDGKYYSQPVDKRLDWISENLPVSRQRLEEIKCKCNQSLQDKTGLKISESINLEENILDHLRALFPKVDILHKRIVNEKGNKQMGIYRIEARLIAFEGTFHGTANYSLRDCYKIDGNTLIKVDDIYKMRGYRGKNCFYVEDDVEELLFKDDDYLITEGTEVTEVDVPKTFLSALAGDLTKMMRMKPFVQEKIIKAGAYKQEYRKYKDTNLEIGHTVRFTRLLAELSIGQFTYKNYKQFERWHTAHNKAKSEYGQGFEGNYQNNDGSLNYAEMIKQTEDAIRTDKLIRCKRKKHPYYENFIAESDGINKLYQFESTD